MSSDRRDTVIHNFLARAEELRDTVVFRWIEEGRLASATGRQLGEQAKRRCAGLLSLDLAPGDRVGIIGRTRPEWFVADMAIQHAGGIVVPLFSEWSDEQLCRCLEETGCRYLFIDDDALLERLVGMKLPSLECSFVSDGKQGSLNCISLSELCARGVALMRAQPDALAERLASIDAGDVFTIVYTSGTTAAPKGVMLTHRNAMCAANAYLKRLPTATRRVYVSYCPLSHISERLASSLIATVPDTAPGEIWFASKPSLLLETLQKARPNSLAGPPVFWMKLRARILAGAAGKRIRGHWAARLIEIGAEVARERAQSLPVRAERALAAWLARQMIGGPIRRQLGLDRLLVGYAAAAALPEEVQYFFEALGIPLRQAWGLTETCGAGAAQSVDELQAGLVGRPHEGLQIRLAPDGEILVRSQCVFAGYWRKPELTRQAIDADGWLHTADIGELLADGRLRILGRKDSAFALCSGTKVWPKRMELAMLASPWVTDAVAVGQGQAYPVVLVALDQEEVQSLVTDGDGAIESHPAIVREMNRCVETFNASVSKAERLGAWRIVQGVFPDSVYTGTGKINRALFEQAFAAEIAELYDEPQAALPAP